MQLQRKISGLHGEISSADKDEDTSWARRSLEEAEGSLASIERRRRRLSETSAVFTAQARKMENLATDHTVRAREFLRVTVDDLKAYFAANFISQSNDQSLLPATKHGTESDQLSTVAQQRVDIAKAIYTDHDVLRGGINTTLKLYNGKTVYFKPKNGESNFSKCLGIAPGTQYIREVAASIIDEALGLNLVPPTEFINYDGEIGSAQLALADYFTATRLPKLKNSIKTELTARQRHDWHLFDYVIGNPDRHMANWMATKNGEMYNIAMIDHGLSLSTSEKWVMRAKPAMGEQLDDIDRTRLIQFISSAPTLHKKLTDIGIESQAADLMFSRAKELLHEGIFLVPINHAN